MAIAKSKGFFPVLAALVGNALVTVFKVIAATSSGSSAMFSEAIHSFADTANQALLLVGVTRSNKKPTNEFSYGFGNERFFWALISACGIFFVGAGVTMYHGIEALQHPKPIEISVLTFGVLVFAFIVEALTLWIALRSLARTFPKNTWVERFSLADPYLAVLSRWLGGRDWLPEACPKLAALGRAVARRPAIAPVWARHLLNG